MPTSAVVKYRRQLIAHALFALCIVVTARIASAAGDCDPADALSLVGQAALDGDTLRTEDGREWRLAGVLAPKRGDGARLPSGDGKWPHPPERPPNSPADAARVALKALVQGQSLWLKPLGETADRHGRRIATVFDASCKALAEQLLLAGHVRVYPTPASRQLVVAFYRLEAVARSETRGLWGDRRYGVLSAGGTDGKSNSYVVVQGRVVSVVAQRSVTMLLFGPDRGRDFAVAIEPKVRKLLVTAGREPAGLTGKAVRVRGWLRQKGGAPVIDLVVPEQLEVVE